MARLPSPANHASRRSRPLALCLLLGWLRPGVGGPEQEEIQANWRTYAQLTVEVLPGEGLPFAADRIRIRTEAN